MFSFKKFLENYYDGLEDEFNLTWQDIVNTYEKEGWMGIKFILGKEAFKSGIFEIVPGSMTKDGVSIIIKNKTRSYLPGNIVNNKSLDHKVYHLDSKQFINLITKGFIPY